MIILFAGIPGCGKTTIAKKLATRLRKLGRVKLYVSDKLKPPVYQKFFNFLKQDRFRYNFLIFDATFYKKKWRDKMTKLAQGEEVVLIYIRCLLQSAIARNQKRRNKISQRAVHIIFNQFEEPRNPDLIINSEKDSPLQAAEKIFNYITK